MRDDTRAIPMTPARPESAAPRTSRDPRAELSGLRVRRLSFASGFLLGPARSSLLLPQIAWYDAASGTGWLALGTADEVSASDETGAAEAIETCRARLAAIRDSDGLLRYFGGLAFDPTTGPHRAWPAGRAARFVLPRILMRQTRGPEGPIDVAILSRPGEAPPGQRVSDVEGRRATSGEGRGETFDPDPGEAAGAGRGEPAWNGTEGAAWLQRACGDAPSEDAWFLPQRIDEEGEERSRWEESVERALEAIRSGQLRKIVLAREIDYRLRNRLDPWALFERIVAHRPYGRQFCFRFDEDSAFLGASPERLLVQAGSIIACDCLAGTGTPGRSPEEDDARKRALLASEKDLREHRFVLEGILAALEPHAEKVDAPESPEVLSLPRLLHLWTPVRAQLRDGAVLGEIVGKLHPTPAVGGFPRAEALRMIRLLEGRSRGWYAGPVGWVSRSDADLAVAIRVAILGSQRLTLLGGAGIVAGSDPRLEWEETARKAGSFLSLLATEPA